MKNYLVSNNYNLIDDVFNSFFARPEVSEARVMPTNVKRSENALSLEIEIPGFKKEDLSIAYENGYLTVSAEKTVSEEDKKDYVRFERASKLSRMYKVGEINEDGISAKYVDGVLYVELPFESKKEAKKIFIE